MVSFYIFNETTEKIAIAIENTQIKELIIDRPDQPQQVGNIYLGKVKKVEKGLQAAFIDIGADQDGFLQRKELPFDPDTRIESLITEGQTLLVQVVKDAYESKGARLTANITLPGQYLIYLPYGDNIVISRKLTALAIESKKEMLASVIESKEGIILRTAASEVADDVIKTEFIMLRSQMNQLFNQAKSKKAPSLLFEDSVAERVIRSYSPSEINQINVDSSVLSKHLKQKFPTMISMIHWKKSMEQALPMTIDQLFKQLLHPVVTLENGITLTIEETEAMVVIDVNSGGFADRYHQGKTHVKTNLFAATAIAEQIRLRNLSGIIIIDFIDMKSTKEQQKVIHALRKVFAFDRMKTVVYGFTKLGLLEITRKREAPSITKLLGGQPNRKKVAYAPLSFVFSLERTLYQYQTSEVEALLIQVEPKVLELWYEYIDQKKIEINIKQSIYFEKTKGVTGFHIKRVGTQDLIKSYMEKNKDRVIDKLV
ncbi:Ribonuclease G [Paraliobacillus sp. PM-2]|uniref:Rne/Rng family ribonuclease n=1 Tax=Paraliobacillus sp. PM-2 TaxID=1462524 RepID=UPI00061CD710|nr:Rne/Rng family ribonuclease [Paraliobacillus sp. PM-2]CQR48001.1 Ribonuclease G [Paraliobacillus sp. PM-2]